VICAGRWRKSWSAATTPAGAKLLQARQAEELTRQIRALDADEKFEEFLVRLFDHFGVQVEDHGARSYICGRGISSRMLSRPCRRKG